MPVRLGPLELRRRRREAAPSPVSGQEDARLAYTCNICGSRQEVPVACLDRESVSCRNCESNVRFRALVHVLTESICGQSQVLEAIPVMEQVRGLGLSDWEGYAEVLARKCDYRNTRFDREPQFDITRPDDSERSRYDFVIASDVFEHVLPPVSDAFGGAYAVLRPGGVLVLTVPYMLGEDCHEHYPGAVGYQSMGKRGVRIQHPNGDYMAVEPVFHGGPGATLEMRRMSLRGVLAELRAAGFKDIRVHGEPALNFGIVHLEPLSLPITARKPSAQ